VSIKINQLDLFSGIGGFHLGFERAGYEVTSYFSEIDKHAVAVYQHKFKDATYVGSVTDVRGADPSIYNSPLGLVRLPWGTRKPKTEKGEKYTAQQPILFWRE
jgi:site-specific DNA-cytosine methylase